MNFVLTYGIACACQLTYTAFNATLNVTAGLSGIALLFGSTTDGFEIYCFNFLSNEFIERSALQYTIILASFFGLFLSNGCYYID